MGKEGEVRRLFCKIGYVCFVISKGAKKLDGTEKVRRCAIKNAVIPSVFAVSTVFPPSTV